MAPEMHGRRGLGRQILRRGEEAGKPLLGELAAQLANAPAAVDLTRLRVEHRRRPQRAIVEQKHQPRNRLRLRLAIFQFCDREPARVVLPRYEAIAPGEQPEVKVAVRHVPEALRRGPRSSLATNPPSR